MIIERRGSTPRRSDSGFTLIELLMAIVLGGIIAGVTVAALATSMHIAKSTTDQVNDSNDAGLVAAFFFRDAQSAGATDPATATADPSLGVSVDDSAAGWGGCTQVGALVVRFSWVERRSSAAPHAVTVTYALDDINELTRRLCADGTSVDVVVGRSITAASVACQPDPSCTSRPTSATLTVTGSAAGVPLTSSLTASLRGDVQAAPQSANSSPVGLVALGVPVSSVPCPNLTLGGSGTLNVIGDVMVDARCGSVPISDPSGLLRPTGTTSTIAGIVDPFAGRTPPSGSCASAGANPVPIGSSSGPAAVIVYPQAVSISTAVEFEAGTHVFCAGLDIAAGASVTGSDILLYLADGSLVVDAATTVDLAASPTGAYAQLLIWIAAPETVVIAGGPRVGSFAGYVYAPSSTVQLSSELAANIGGIIAKDVIFSGPGEARIGLAVPDLVIGPTTGPRAQVGVAYTAQMSVSGGVAPWTWTATGLAPGLDIDPSTGDITGVPTAAGTFAAIITVFESTRAAASIDYTVSVAEPLLIGGPGALPMGQVGVVYAPTTAPTSGGTAPFTWSAVGLPPGLGIDSATGLISGSPTGAGSFDVTVTVTDAMSGTATLTDTIVVHPPLTISGPGSIPNGQAGVVYPATSVIAAGGTAPRTWSATGLPAGLTIGASTGTISGTPTSFGSFNAVVTVTDAMSGVATTDYVLAVSSPPMVSDPGAIPDGYVGSDFTPTSIAATGGTQPFAWSAVGLPSGMSIGAATGIMSGTPLVAGTFDVTVTVTDTLSDISPLKLKFSTPTTTSVPSGLPSRLS